MLDRLLKFFSRSSKQPPIQTICGTPLVQSGELKLVDEMVSDTLASSDSNEIKAAAKTPSYLPPPAWVNIDSDSAKSKSKK